MPKFEMPEIDWSELSIDTAGLVNKLSFQINNANWASIGAGVGAALATAVKAGFGAIVWANEMVLTLQARRMPW